MPALVTTERALGRAWLVRLRWVAVLGQAATVGFAHEALEHPMPLPLVLGLVGGTALSNLVLPRVHREWAVPATVVFDLGVLTALLALTGGASNPFSVLYLLHVALAAVLLGARWAAGIALLSALGFALQFPFTDPHAMHRGGEGVVQAHLLGMWVGFAATAGGIAWFVARLADALRRREAELEVLRREAERNERVMSLATLAAGAAHELGSPLAAIAVAARELERLSEDPALAEEAATIRTQVERCRDIVTRLTQRAGAPQAEPLTTVPTAALWEDVRGALAAAQRPELTVADGGGVWVRVPRAAFGSALLSVVENGLRAGGPVTATTTREGGMVRLTVSDRGPGMPAEVLARAGEPFFTTRPAGDGMGLGLFLTRRLVEASGGRFELASTVGAGTRVSLVLPEVTA